MWSECFDSRLTRRRTGVAQDERPNSLEFQCSEVLLFARRAAGKRLLRLRHHAPHPWPRKPAALRSEVARTGILSSTPAYHPRKDPSARTGLPQDENHQHFCQVFSVASEPGGGAQDGAGEVSGEAIVDVDDSQAGRTGFSMARGRQPLEGRAVAYGRRDGHHGGGDEPATTEGRAPSIPATTITPVAEGPAPEQPVDAATPTSGPGHGGPLEAGRDRSLGHGGSDVPAHTTATCRPGAPPGDLHGDAAGVLLMDRARQAGGHQPERFRGGTGDQDVVAPGGDPLRDGRHLLRRLACPEDDFRPARAGLPGVVDGREAQVLGGIAGQPCPGVGRAGCPSRTACRRASRSDGLTGATKYPVG